MCIHNEYHHASTKSPNGEVTRFLVGIGTQTVYQILRVDRYQTGGNFSFFLIWLRKPDNSTVYHVVEECECGLNATASLGG